VEIHKIKKMSRFETLLGVAVIGIAVLCLPWLDGALDGAKGIDTRAEAGRIAQAVLDYHTETGRWPVTTGAEIDLAILADGDGARTKLAAGEMVGTMLPGDKLFTEARPWLDEVPIDAWGRPFRVYVLDERAPTVIIDDGAAGDTDLIPPKPAPFPDVPPAGVAIVVISPGPDGVLDTEPRRLARAPVPRTGGDDVGFVLQGTSGDPLGD